MKKGSSFDKDLALGKQGEYFILRQILKKYSSARIIPGYFKGYDINVPEAGAQIECKLDELSFRTGHIAIEYEYKGSSSGINVTQANMWALIFYSEDIGKWVWGLIETKTLKHLCVTNGESVIGGQDKQSKMYLLKTRFLTNNPYISLNTIKE